ncbi:MAG: redoxin domain-containing protein [Flavobacteriales bacterium]|nr:redoxin domain-containing protein [Flavobacteriales bacterium]MCB9194323.1 redoxin domain-containing protein [Flavobacteriales bacterium]
MKRCLPALLVLIPLPVLPQGSTLRVHAPTYAGEQAVLYRYDDLFTMRTVRLDEGTVSKDSVLILHGSVDGTTKALLMVGDVGAELFLRNGTRYDLEFPPLPAKDPRSVNGTDRVDPVFHGLDPLDPNALVTDLNERLDAFVSADLATDEVAGMQAVEVLHQKGGSVTRPDSVTRPPTLFYTDHLSDARLDTFDTKLRRFYSAVKDPWFQRDLDLGLGGLRLGPRSNDRALYDRYLKDRAPAYDVPEFVRFFRSFFQDHLMTHPFRTDEKELLRLVKHARADSLEELLMGYDPLKGDPRMTELVLIDGLYQAHPGKLLDRPGIEDLLRQVSTRSDYPEHRRIAANMLWDLTAMRPGARLPELPVTDLDGSAVDLDTLLTNASCLTVTAGWCTYCEVEMRALQQLDETYPGVMRQVVLLMDDDVEAAKRYAGTHGAPGWTWLLSSDPARTREELRCRTVPEFYLLNGRVLARAPAPRPSQGMGAILHRMQVEEQDHERIKFGDDAPPPTRR